MVYQYEKKTIFGNVLDGGLIVQAVWTCYTLIIFSVSVLTIWEFLSPVEITL